MVDNKINRYKRRQTFEGGKNESIFLWGVRQTGKSTLLRTLFPDTMYIDLLMTTEYKKYLLHPELLRETLLVNPKIKQDIILAKKSIFDKIHMNKIDV
jgi:predicted AAA+ superfamily ATPase